MRCSSASIRQRRARVRRVLVLADGRSTAVTSRDFEDESSWRGSGDVQAANAGRSGAAARSYS